MFRLGMGAYATQYRISKYEQWKKLGLRGIHGSGYAAVYEGQIITE